MTTATSTDTKSTAWASTAPIPAPEFFEDIPREQRTISDLWNRALGWGQDRPYIRFEGQEYATYAEIRDEAAAWADRYRELGAAKGDHIALMLPNSRIHLAALLGALLSGRPIVPVNLMHKGQMLRHVLTDSSAVLMVTDAESAQRLDLSWDLPALEHVVIIDPDSDQAPADPRVTTGPASGSSPSQSPFDTEQHFTDIAAILYTSGTTGPSKGAVVTHEYCLYSMWHQASSMGHTDSDVLFSTLPMFHVNALFVTVFPSVMVGSRSVVYPHFSAGQFWDQIVENDASHFSAIGTMGNILMKRPESEYHAGHRLRCCQITPPPDQAAEFEKRFSVPISSGYGMTEANIVRPSRDGTFRPSLAGRRYDYYELKIVDDADGELPTGQVGEIVVRPKLPGIMFREYLGRPEATAEAFRNLWFHTGDHGRLDENGDLFFEGRRKDAIRRRGENVSAFEVEREVGQYPGVGDVAAIGVKSDLGEEEIMICVTALDGHSLDAVDLHAYCREHLPRFMIPRFVDIRDALPKNSSARILKHELRTEGVRSTTFDAGAAVKGNR